jgi:hypothetical protein
MEDSVEEGLSPTQGCNAKEEQERMNGCADFDETHINYIERT